MKKNLGSDHVWVVTTNNHLLNLIHLADFRVFSVFILFTQLASTYFRLHKFNFIKSSINVIFYFT